MDAIEKELNDLDKEYSEKLRLLRLKVRPIKSDAELKRALLQCDQRNAALWDSYEKKAKELSLQEKILKFFYI